jgi:hypothetical protein
MEVPMASSSSQREFDLLLQEAVSAQWFRTVRETVSATPPPKVQPVSATVFAETRLKGIKDGLVDETRRHPVRKL